MTINLLLKYGLRAILVTIVAVAYTNCGSFESGQSSILSSSNNSSSVEDDDLAPIPFTKTASVLRGSRALDTLVSCLSLEKPSAAAQTEYQKIKTSLSEEGLANTVSQPMVKGLVGLSAVVCNDLVVKERALAQEDRIFFGNLDFTTNRLVDGQIDDIVKRMSRACWGRNPSSSEIKGIRDSINQNFTDMNATAAALNSRLIYTCTAMMSSFSTYEL